MESNTKKGLASLPVLVYTEGLLPLLSVNEILRLRRVCKPLKSICDDHLKNNCPSKALVCLQYYENKRQRCKDSLFTFLKRDEKCSIRIPSNNFYLNYGKSIGKLSLNFSRRYGKQIKHLSMEKLVLPFVANSSEFRFFKNLPNLPSLTLSEIVVEIDSKYADHGTSANSLPTCFKKNIKKFEVSSLMLDQKSDASIFWETVALMEKLECFRCPGYFILEDPTNSQCQILENCCKLIGRESSNIQCLDLKNLDEILERSIETVILFSELSLKKKIKWKNVPAWIFEKPLYKAAWMKNADMIVSIRDFSSQNTKGLSFPNLTSLKVSNISFGLPTQLEVGVGNKWSKIPQILSPSVYPALKILKISKVMAREDDIYFAMAWHYLTNLEEVSFSCFTNLSKFAFLGHENKTHEPPFLRLTRLKKLSFHIPRDQRDACSINNVFHKAFRLMPLKELNITSENAISGDIFTKDAILALCSPGPFIKNIEKFPFRNWSMENVTRDEFQQLGRKFPNNQPL